MIFSTTAFLYFFLPLFLAAYVLLPWKNLTALSFSLLFFAWGEGVYLILLLAVVWMNFLIGAAVHKAENDKLRRILVCAGVSLNLAVLAYYKYWGFLVNDVLAMSLPAESLPILPLGISFFIFQSISYLVDVYRREATPAQSVYDLALYIAMFPQLIAGPIVRYGDVDCALRQRAVSFFPVVRGLQLFAMGLAFKVLIANQVAVVADAAFGAPADQLAPSTAWLGITAYTLQIFFDFAGYSLMAIGLGRVMGFRFPRNFNHPYVSRSITEFWRRWHMSLSSWFRDYLYIPLGGNRGGAVSTYRNLFVVFLLCGLWHGAAWSFVAWGLFHGSLLVLERAGLNRLLTKIPEVFAHLYLLTAVMIGWVLFRADTLSQAWSYLQAMFRTTTSLAAVGPWEIINHQQAWVLALAVVFCFPVLERTRWRQWDENSVSTMPTSALVVDVTVITLLFTLCSVFVLSGTYNPFIYFRF
ncbi:MAG: MBOAT family O-acyltransferase [Pseudomonadota bacterium]